MIDVLRSATAIIFLFSFAIFIHELGHFMFAKLFGVYVETFSIGFGKKIWRRQWGETEYAISLVPFGGYVKMKGMMSKEMEALIDDEKSAKESKQSDPQENVVGPSHVAAGEPAMEEVATIHIPHTAGSSAAGDNKITNLSESVVDEMAALRTKPYYQRILIFSAGCINNLLTAVFVFFMMNWIGHHRAEPMKPVVDRVKPAYAASVPLQRGDLVVKVGPTETDTYMQFLTAFTEQAKKAPASGNLEITVERNGTRIPLVLPINLAPGTIAKGERIVQVGEKSVKTERQAAEQVVEKMEKNEMLDVVVESGGRRINRKIPASAVAGPYWPELAIEPDGPAYVGLPVPNLPAEKAGMKPHDMILSVNGTPVKTLGEASEIIRAAGGKSIPVVVERGSGKKKEQKTLTVQVREDPETKGKGQIGIHWGAPLTDFYKKPAGESLSEAFLMVGNIVVRYLQNLKKLFTSSFRTIRENLGGPIAIGVQTHKVAQLGWSWFWDWMAMFNIMLAVTNLLPLPILDGGHILFATIESIIRRPLPAKAMMWMYNIFITMFLSLVVLITANDFIMNAWRLFN